jgi:signal transduction histidine kinase
MPEGGRLTVEVRCDDAASDLEICFADEGIGMDPREVEGYFQPFRSSFEQGTGLGAAIVYRIVQEHAGRIQLDSTPGRGTRVRIAIPRWCVGPGSVESLTLQPAHGGSTC